MKILITGASGKIGSHIVESLRNKHSIIALVRKAGQEMKNIESFVADTSNFNQLNSIFQNNRPDVVIHLAAALPAVCSKDKVLAHKINVEATVMIGELAKKYGVKKFIFASTAGVYTQSTLEPTNEIQNINPQSIYAETKLLAEQGLEQLSEKGGTNFIVLRVFNVYGDNFTDSLIYKLTHSLKDQPVELCGPENYYRDYIHVSDVVKAVELTLLPKINKQFICMNIASGKAVNNSDLLRYLHDSGIQASYITKPCATTISWADISLAKKKLGFKPHTKLIL